jgi:hypothetical protein
MDQQIEIRARLAADVVRDLPPHAAAALAVIGERLTNAMTENRDWQVLFLDYWARAVRDPVIGARFAEHRRAARQVITEAIVKLAQSLNVTMPLPPDLVTLVILGLSNGLAVEELADPGTVPSSLIGTVLNRLAAPSS